MPAVTHPHIMDKLSRVYGAEAAPAIYEKLKTIIGDAPPRPPETLKLSEADVMLITYGDQVHDADEAPLKTLGRLVRDRLAPQVNSIHILPFFPYSSDDGFSVIDYTAVDPKLGSWANVRDLSADFRLMFDAVFNHISAKSEWFQAFLRDEAPYSEYFTVVDPGTDLSMVVRPRALPLLTPVETPGGTRHVWTTFSADQVDLNFANPDVLIDLLKILLFYIERGAQFIRLDAIAFIWKEIGTSSIHLEQTHLLIQLMRDVLDIAAPATIIITETNVPHEENISYFGDGRNEAQMVYQFPLPPLVLHTMRTGNTRALTEWAASLEPVGDRTSFFNFTASHDGIGMRPVTGLLRDDEVAALVQLATDHGGLVSYRALPDGGQQPYELNISYFDAITNPAITAAQPDTAVARFLVSQAIELAMIGVPGIYFHSLFGSRNWRDGVERTKHNRTINRQKLDYGKLQAELDDPNSIRHKVYSGYLRLLDVRRGQPAFHPLGSQVVHKLSDTVFAVERISPEGAERVLALTNVTAADARVDLPGGEWDDLLSEGGAVSGQITLTPYQIAWLKAV